MNNQDGADWVYIFGEKYISRSCLQLMERWIYVEVQRLFC